MRSWKDLGKGVMVCMVVATITLGVSSAQAARRPGPLCGPTILWSCVLPNGNVVPFAGTVCERAAYEMQTGATCKPGL